MSQEHKDFIVKSFPDLKGKIFLYKDFAGMADTDNNITDPIGQSLMVYKGVRDQIKNATQKIIKRVKGDL